MAPDRWTARCKGASFCNAKWVPGSDCVVPFDDVIDALQELDEKSDGGDSGGIEGSQPGHRDRHRGGDQEKGRREAEFGTESYPGRDHLWAS
jgi:hypothetical protein